MGYNTTKGGDIVTLKQLRKADALSQCELAAQIGISQQAYSNIESGKHPPGYKVARKIGKRFQLTGGEIWAMFYDRDRPT